MTVKELYEWAKERNCLDVQIAKHFHFQVEDIREATHLTRREMIYLNVFSENGDRVILD